MVSIIMPAYNASKTIQAAIDSVLAQTYNDWELIIIDDKSQDDTLQIIRFAAAKDSRIIFLTNEQNLKTAKTRNNGIGQAKGEWLAFLDSDDTWDSAKLEKQLRFIHENEAQISYTATAYVYEGIHSGFILHAEQELTYKDLLKRNIMSCSSVMVHRDTMIPFPEGNLHEDYAAWLTILHKVKRAYGLNEPLLTYRVSSNSNSGNRIKSARMTFNAYRNVDYGVFTSLILTFRYSFHSIYKHTSIKRLKVVDLSYE